MPKWGNNIKVVESFEVDATEFHTCRIVRTPDRILTMSVDDVLRLKTDKRRKAQPVRFGATGHNYYCFGTSLHIPGQASVRHAVVPQKTKGESY